MGFLKAIFIFFLVYYLFKVLVKMFAPKILSYAAKKTEAHFQGKFGDFVNQNRHEEEDINNTITTNKSNKKGGSSEKVGEYIDFEEVD